MTKTAIALLTPPLAAASAWLCAAVGKYGVHLDKTGVAALAVAGATGAITLGLKLIHDLEHKLEADHVITESEVAAIGKAVTTTVSKADPQVGAELGWPSG